MNKESFSGVIYNGVMWFNTHDSSEKWLKSIYENDKGIELKKCDSNCITNKLVVDGKKV